ncbi:MAG TPA: type 4a pilus biogenesis protein PilO [Candidatus Paceibacterota bacterium]|nr:type 4a pilus biogenesis protein PilO [Candidatus Paceibacterota bacterium]
MKAYLGALIVVAAAFIFWAFVMPSYDHISSAREAVAARDAELTQRTSLIDQINSWAQQYSQHSSDISRFSYIVPETKSSPELVSMLEAIVHQSGLTLNGIALGNIDPNNQAASYQTQGIDLTITGTYPAFRSFLSAIEQNIRIIDITSINAAPVGAESSDIQFRLKANTYFLTQ